MRYVRYERAERSRTRRPVRRVMPVELVIRQSTVGCVAQDFSPSFAVEPVVAII